MGSNRSSFGKLERERAKRAKAAAKRERRLAGGDDVTADEELAPAPTPASGGQMSNDRLLAEIEALHQRFDDGAINYDDFEKTKADLLSRLAVD